MQSKTSFFNKTIFKKNLGRTWALGLLSFILLCAELPMPYFSNIASITADALSQGYTHTYYMYQQLAYSSAPILYIFLAIAANMLVFWYLFSKRDSYMMHSFPVSRKTLYFTGLISSLTVLLIPLLAVGILTTIIALATGAACISGIWYWVFIGVTCIMIFTGISLFAMMLTGQAVTAVIFYFIFNFVFLGMEYAFRYLASSLMFGMSYALTFDPNILTPVAYITSNCEIDMTINWDEGYNKMLPLGIEFKGASYLIIYLIAAVILLAVAYFLYKSKKLETVNDFITVKVVETIFSVGMSFFVSMVLGVITADYLKYAMSLGYSKAFAIAIVSALIYGVIIYYIAKMLIAKTVRVFKKKTAIGCIIYSVAALAVLLCVRFDVFTIENKTPDASDVCWAGVEISSPMVFDTDDEIQSVIDIHRSILENKKEICEVDALNLDSTNVSVRYRLADGSTLIRSYCLYDPETIDALDVDTTVSDEYRTAANALLDFVNNPERIKEHVICKSYNDGTVTDLSFSTYTWNAEAACYEAQNAGFSDLTASELTEKYQKIYEAFLKDIDEGKALKQSLNPDTDNMLYNDFNFTLRSNSGALDTDNDLFYDNDYYGSTDESRREIYFYFNLDRGCSNTLQVLKEEGFYTDDSQIVTYGEVNGTNEGVLHTETTID